MFAHDGPVPAKTVLQRAAGTPGRQRRHGVPAAPAQAPPPRRPARPPVNEETVKWGLAAAGALIPPALFVMAAYGPHALAFLAFPLLFIDRPAPGLAGGAATSP